LSVTHIDIIPNENIIHSKKVYLSDVKSIRTVSEMYRWYGIFRL